MTQQIIKKHYALTELLESIPINIEGLIRAYGLELDKNADLSEGILGQLKYQDNNFKILVKRTDHYYRKRFTMAHELGHFLLHKGKMAGNIIDDVNTLSGGYSAINRDSSISNKEEVEANNYAAQVLMPKDLLIKYAKDRGAFNSGKLDDEALQEMATAFQVSKAAMKIRIEGLKNEILTN